MKSGSRGESGGDRSRRRPTPCASCAAIAKNGLSHFGIFLYNSFMERLLFLDGKNYTDDMPEIVRIAVRGIIFVDGKLLLIEDNKQEVKLPGGGQEEGETDLDTLIREVREETGCTVIAETVRPFGYIEEKRKSFDGNTIWHQFSRLYFCDVSEKRGDTAYSENEKQRGMRFGMYTPEEAIAKNQAMLNKLGALAWNQREYRTLLLIRAHMEKPI